VLLTITEEETAGYAMIDLGREIAGENLRLSFRRRNLEPRHLGSGGWQAEAAWLEIRDIVQKIPTTVARLGPSVVSRIDELEQIEIVCEGVGSLGVVWWPAMARPPIGLESGPNMWSDTIGLPSQEQQPFRFPSASPSPLIPPPPTPARPPEQPSLVKSNEGAEGILAAGDLDNGNDALGSRGDGIGGGRAVDAVLARSTSPAAPASVMQISPAKIIFDETSERKRSKRRRFGIGFAAIVAALLASFLWWNHAALSIDSSDDLTFTSDGGPFHPSSFAVRLTATGGEIRWTAETDVRDLDIHPSSGTIPAYTSVEVELKLLQPGGKSPFTFDGTISFIGDNGTVLKRRVVIRNGAWR
jgi:hypothetical protein